MKVALEKEESRMCLFHMVNPEPENSPTRMSPLARQGIARVLRDLGLFEHPRRIALFLQRQYVPFTGIWGPVNENVGTKVYSLGLLS